MAEPLTPEEEQAIISKYWGLSGENAQASGSVRQPTSFARDLGPPPPAPIAYQPNPGAAGYSPNPGATTATPADSQGAVLGALPGPRKAPTPSAPLFQNPLNLAPVEGGELGGPPVGGTPVDAGEIDRPPAPTGPTATDDAQFAAFRAKQDEKAGADAKKVAAYWGGSPAKTSNPDPFGQLAAQKGRLGAYDDQMGAMGRARDADAVKATQIAEGQRDLARMQDEDAAIARLQGDIEKKHFDDGMQEIGRQLDDVRAAKLDPLRQMKESPALGVLAVIGGGLSGFYQGITGGQRNEFLDDLDRQLDRAHAEDERQLTDKKFVIGQGANLLGEQRQVQKDDNLARLQTRNLQYEAVKKQIDAQATEDEIPAARARADEMIAQTHGAQQLLADQIANAKRTQAAAAGAAGVAQAKEVRDFRFKVYEKMLAEGYSPAQAEAESRRQVAVQYLGGVGARPRGGDMDRPAMTREQSGKITAEHGETERSTAEFNNQIDSLKKHPAIQDGSVLTGPLSHFGSRIAPDSAHDAQSLKSINMQLQAAVGKMAKDADGKPRKEVQEHIENTYFLDNSDSVPMRLQKLDDARDYVNALARQEGASGAPKPNAKATLSAELGAKPIR